MIELFDQEKFWGKLFPKNTINEKIDAYGRLN